MDTRSTFRIGGRVQGVCFRMAAEQEARRLGLSGWVRNTPDGDVEGVVEGPSADVDDFLAWARRGPPAARVQNVSASRTDATGEFRGFRIRY